MYLKKLEMRGFKTFADRTELDFGPGVTAIVGPNGVGKSNISDAIQWVLGEQSNRALRTEASQDVIFAGSEQRRPLGMAEVALTIDNTDSTLSVDYSDVIVSRRLFRSGESEYLLNRSNARLRDIRDLFLDTGVGPGAYSVVGQGEIDAILSIRSEDRRELLEEVAGVRKYRIRRDETNRKLDATEANMTRVADIVAELTSQREPLEKEAETARKYNEYADRLRELELHLLAGDYQRRRQRVGRLANELEITKADLQGTRNQLSKVDSEYERVQFEMARLADEVDRLRDAATAAERELDQTRQAQALAQERVRAAAARQEDLQVALEGRKRRSVELSEQVENVAVEYAQVVEDHGKAQQERAQLDAELKEKQAAFQEKMQKVRELERTQATILEKARALENEALALGSLEQDLAERSERLSRQAEAMAQRQVELGERVAAAQARREELSQAYAARQEDLQDLRQDLAQSSRDLTEHRQKCNVFSGAVTAAETRQELLEELERSHEGFSDGAKAAIAAAEEGELTGVLGIVADVVNVPAKFERAIEAAFGESLQWVLTQTEEQAAAGALHLRGREVGKVSFVPLTGFTGMPAETPSAQVPGSFGPALKLVRYQREHEPLLAHLIGSTLVVRDLETALSARQRMGVRVRMVTLAGEVVDANGVITAGGEQGAGSQAFARRRELESVTRELDLMRAALEDMWKCEEDLDLHCTRCSEDIRVAEAELSQLRSERAATDSDANHLADQLRAAQKASAELTTEADGIDERLAEAGQRRQTAQENSEKLSAEAKTVGEQIEQGRRQGVGQAEVDALRAQQVNAQVRAAELAEKERSVQHLRQRFTSELQRVTQEIAQAEAELKAAYEAQEELQSELDQPGVDLHELEQKAGAARAHVNERAAALSDLREKSAELETMRGRLNQVAQEQTDRLHRSELGLAREDTQLEAIAERLKDTYDVTPEEAFAERDEEFNEQEIRREANELRENIRKLGPVSLSAIDECDRLRAREEFLSAQLGDLEAAKADLLQVIKEIDDAATEEFLLAFERMQGEFQGMFERLFGGGTTELKLTNPEFPLDSGVDVIVQVPGKRQQNLLLLSGGERSLTASALLFAMLRVRPSPFVVLDEIDAALDEANVERFVNVLADFAEDSQFIIVTHNPATIKCADTLFGITMQDAGVSRLIRLELREWEDFLAEAEDQVAAVHNPHAGSRVLPTTT